MPVITAAVFVSLVVADPSALPLRKLRLYETGVGYFERRGNVGPRGDLALPLPSSHLDDALKSLVILEATGGVRVKGVDFGSSVSEGMARAMAGLPEDGEDALGYGDLLESLRGSRVQVQTPDGKVRGRFVDLEGPFYLKESDPKDGSDPERSAPAAPRGEPHYTLILLDEDDALRRIKTDRVEAVRVLDERTAARLDVAATALSDQLARQTSQLEVQVSSGGRLGLGYITESPVWRTTYRVVIDDDEPRGQLQAWALVHNDTDEDWDTVMVELANGRPSSFLHPMAAPRYAERELIDPPDGLSTVPQLANRTVDSLVGTEIGGAYGVGGLGLVGTGRGGGGMGMGHGYGVAGMAPEDGGVELGDLAQLAQAAGTESGALFLYRVADPIDLEAHHSALLPIVQEDIEVESITFFSVEGSEGLSAARVVNTTSQTLPPGTVSFFADGGFVGEALFDRLKPKERRFVPYGFELDVELERGRETLGERVTVLRFHEGKIVESYVEESELRLTVDNRSGRTRRVYVALDVPRRAELTGDGRVELDYDLANDTPLAATEVGAGRQVEHLLRSKELRSRTHGDLSLSTLVALSKREGIPAPQRELLKTTTDLSRRAVELDAEVTEAHETIGHLEGDLARIREDLTALGSAGGRSTARTKLTRELLGKETKIDRLRKEIEQATDGAKRARRKVRTTMERLNEWTPETGTAG